MSNKIEGVPEGWKIDCIRASKEGDYIPMFNIISEEIEPFLVRKKSGYENMATAILKRDIKIIDMSKCKVDIEWRELDADEWAIDPPSEMAPSFQNRVRQNHYFGWEGGDCPLPEGLFIRATFAESREDVLHIYSMDAISHELEFDNPCLIGFEVKRPCAGYAYKHEIEGGEV